MDKKILENCKKLLTNVFERDILSKLRLRDEQQSTLITEQ